MPKVNPWDVVKYIIQGLSEDFTRKKALSGIGKWEDIELPQVDPEVMARYLAKKSKTPKRMALSPERAEDIKQKVAMTNWALWQ